MFDLLFFLIVLFFVSYDHFGQSFEANVECNIVNTAIRKGEKIVYKGYYNWEFIWVPAGEAIFYFEDKGDTYQITVTGKTYKTYNAFFKVNDFFCSVVDKKSMLPKTFVRIVEEGNYRRFDSIVFDHKKLVATSFNGSSRHTAIKKEVFIPPCTHDLLSVLYFMRNINISAHKPGDIIPTFMFFDETFYPINVKYEGKYDRFEIKDLGIFNTIKVIPDLVTGNIFKDGNRMQVWVTNDRNKLPLLVESPLKVGSAKAILKSVSNNRYDIDGMNKE